MNPFSPIASRARKLLHRRCIALSIASVLAGGLTQLAAAQEHPEPLQALERQGITIVGTFPSPGGLIAWAADSGLHPVALYATPDEKHVIAGTLLDVEGQDINRSIPEKMVSKPMTDGVWGRLQSSRWVADGSDKAPKTVYVFTDLNCPYCNKLWSDARPWINAGKVQLRHIIVGILTPTSPGKAAALLADKNAAAVLASYERGQVAATAKAMTSGRPHPLTDDSMKPLASVPPAIQRQLDANEKIMTDLGLRATPAVVWRDGRGAVQMRTGLPDQALAEVFGPK